MHLELVNQVIFLKLYLGENPTIRRIVKYDLQRLQNISVITDVFKYFIKVTCCRLMSCRWQIRHLKMFDSEHIFKKARFPQNYLCNSC